MKKRIIAAMLVVTTFWGTAISAFATGADTPLQEQAATAFTLGEVKDNAYENTFFNVRFPILNNMAFDSSDQVDRLNGQLAQYASTDTGKQLIADGKTVIVASASNRESTLLNVSINNVGKKFISQYDEQSLLAGDTNAIASEFEKIGYTAVNIVVDTVNFLGEDHPSLLITGKIKGNPFYERQVCLVKDDYIAVFTVSGRNDNAFSLINQATKIN